MNKHALRCLLTAAALVATLGPAFAQNNPLPVGDPNRMVTVYLTGEQLTSLCRAYLLKIRQNDRVNAQEASDSGLCYGYVAGVLEATSMEGTDISPSGLPRLCMPQDHLYTGTVTEIVARYVDGHPERRGASGYTLVREALAAAYPCR